MLIKRVVLVIFCIIVAGAANAESWCEGRQPIPHNDGNYQFSTESWIRERAGAYFYGRCIKTIKPTNAMWNHWEGVLPRSIAYGDSPTQGGQSFLSKDSLDVPAILRYGNADDSINQSYFAHISEKQSSNTDVLRKDSNIIKRIIEERGEVILESVYSFFFNAFNEDENSISKINLKFESGFDGEKLSYSFVYDLNVPYKFSEIPIIIGFPDKQIQSIFKSQIDSSWLNLSNGRGKLTVYTESPGGADFVSFKINLYAGKRIAAEIPVTYMLPVLQ